MIDSLPELAPPEWMTPEALALKRQADIETVAAIDRWPRLVRIRQKKPWLLLNRKQRVNWVRNQWRKRKRNQK
jgi:hypothetical protein